MKTTILRTVPLLCLVIGAAPLSAQRPDTGARASPSELVYIGTRADGEKGGIIAARFDPATGTLTEIGKVSDVLHPTWLLASPHRSVLYSVSEIGNDGSAEAAVLSFSADPATGKLTQLSRVGSGGGGATHLAIGGKVPTMFVANYGTGHIAALPVQRGGVLLPAASVVADYGKGADPVRQAGPHAHAVLPDNTGRYVIAADLGADRIFVYRFDPASRKLSPAAKPFVTLPPGSGPRHLAMSNDGRFVYAVTESGSSLVTYRWSPARGELTELSSISLERPTDRVPGSHAAEVVISRDGRFLYASNRGEDTIVTFALDARTGKPSEVQRIAVGARYPTALVFDNTQRWMFVASPGTNSVGVFARDPATGKLTATTHGLTVPLAVTVAVLPPAPAR
jgi:6-phosphogluconolactonase